MSNKTASRGILAVLVVAAGLVAAGGAWAYRVQEDRQRRSAEETLLAVGRLKADEIARWRSERMADAAVLSESPFLAQALGRWLAGDTQVEALLRQRFRSQATRSAYANAVFVDASGGARLALGDDSVVPHEEAVRLLADALATRRPRMTELHRGARGGDPHVAIVAPVFEDAGAASPTLGAIVFVIDARRFLYPLLQSWPTPSPSAETLLVRRAGDDVLFLNDVRHRGDTALSMRVPLTRTEIPAVKAVLGQTGVVEGVDYRGVDVLATLLPIAGTSWFLVAKVDTNEILAPWHLLSAMILALIVAWIGMLASLGGALWWRSRKVLYKSLLEAETTLARTLEGHRTTLLSIGDGVIATNARGNVTMVNPVAEALTGWAEREALDRPLEDVFRIVNEQTRASVENPVRRVLDEGRIVGLANHTVLISRDGTEYPIADSGAPIRDESGAITGVVLVFRDQTAEHEREAALRQSEEKFKCFFENSNAGMSITSLSGALQVNRSFCDMLGYTPDELRQRTWQDVTHADDVEETRRAVQDLLAGRRASARFFKRYLRKDGSVMWGDVSTTLYRDPAGQPQNFITIVMDVTDRRRAEEALRERDILFEKLSSHVPGMIYQFTRDTAGNYTIPYTSDAIRSIFGCSAEDARVDFAPIAAAIHPDDLKSVVESIEHSAATLTVWRCEFRVQISGRPVQWRLGHSTPERQPGGSIVWHGFCTDITEQKQAEQQRQKLELQLHQAQKMEAVGRLAGGVAHDFNNLLTAIRGNVALALDLAGTDPVAQHLRDIEEAGRRASEVTAQLLAYSRRQVLEPRVLDLNVVVDGMSRMLTRLLGEKVRVETIFAPDLWPVKVDRTQIEQILMNLAVNARDAMPRGGRLAFETRNTSLDASYADEHPYTPAGDYVLLAVSDTGAGMDAATLEHVFEPFFTTKPAGEGTGLGLSTVYGIVKQHGGAIEVYSEPGRGTSFKIFLPRGRGEPSADLPAISARKGEDLPTGSETLLLVEDDPAVARILHRMLSPLGYVLLTADSGEAALRSADEYAGVIALLVSDVVMPGMNGPELARRLLERRPDVRVLLVSGYSEEVVSQEDLLPKGVHFLGKPYTRRALAQKVRAVLDGDDAPISRDEP